jgi:Putative cyclase
MSVRTTLGLVHVGTIIFAALLPARSAAPSAASLDQAFVILQAAVFIDLTNEFGPDSPHWKGFAPETVTTLFTIAKDGFHAESFCHPGQWGTHVDPPAHFHDGLKRKFCSIYTRTEKLPHPVMRLPILIPALPSLRMIIRWRAMFSAPIISRSNS